MLSKGEEGIYPLDRFTGVSEEIKRKYFLRGKGEWSDSLRARPELRDLITFRRINLIEQPWPIHTRFDAIFCRNVIIYFNRTVQQQLFERLATYLKEDGYLFVGHSESLHWLSDTFAPLRGTIYRLRSAKTRA
jgi:chemotaxis protein methyltransferase CheR